MVTASVRGETIQYPRATDPRLSISPAQVDHGNGSGIHRETGANDQQDASAQDRCLVHEDADAARDTALAAVPSGSSVVGSSASRSVRRRLCRQGKQPQSRARIARARKTRSSISRPPQTPAGSVRRSAASRQASRTGHTWQTCLHRRASSLPGSASVQGSSG